MKFTFRGPLLRFVEFQREVDVEAATLQGSLEALVARYPSLAPVLLDGDGHIRTAHRLFLNNRMITRGELARPIAPGDRVDILTSLAGG